MDSKAIEAVSKLVMEAMTHNQSRSSTEITAADGYLVPVGVSARHVHLSKQDLETLFGKDYVLTKKKGLMGGQYAAEECVSIIGAKQRMIEKVRILGPLRKESQVEISATDSIKLGIMAPIRDSGDIRGSAPIALVGPMGVVCLKEGCIIAKRHIHMSPMDAQAASVKNGDVVSVKIDSDRGIIFNNVTIRVDDSFTLEMHIDTDEANAANIRTGDHVIILND